MFERMPPACLACSHHKRHELDAALVVGTSIREVAAAFKISKSAVMRHKAGHLVGPSKPSKPPMPALVVGAPSSVLRVLEPAARGRPPTSDLKSREGVLERLARNLERLEAAADEAAYNRVYQALASLAAEVNKTLERVAKLQGLDATPDPPGTSFSLFINLPGQASPEAIATPVGEPATVFDAPVKRGPGRPRKAKAIASVPGEPLKLEFDPLAFTPPYVAERFPVVPELGVAQGGEPAANLSTGQSDA